MAVVTPHQQATRTEKTAKPAGLPALVLLSTRVAVEPTDARGAAPQSEECCVHIYMHLPSPNGTCMHGKSLTLTKIVQNVHMHA